MNQMASANTLTEQLLHYKDGISSALRYSMHSHSFDHVVQAVLNGKLHFYPLTDDSFIIMEVNEYPLDRALKQQLQERPSKLVAHAPAVSPARCPHLRRSAMNPTAPAMGSPATRDTPCGDASRYKGNFPNI